MKRYYIEYEFKSPLDNYYWFPLFINAENSDLAKIISKTIETAIKEQNTLIRSTEAQLIIDGINSQSIKEYIRQRQRGKVEILEFDVWRFRQLPTIPELNFNEHMELVEFGDHFDNKAIATLVERKQFPVRMYSGNPDIDFHEFLLINVVDPFKVDKL